MKKMTVAVIHNPSSKSKQKTKNRLLCAPATSKSNTNKHMTQSKFHCIHTWQHFHWQANPTSDLMPHWSWWCLFTFSWACCWSMSRLCFSSNKAWVCDTVILLILRAVGYSFLIIIMRMQVIQLQGTKV